MTTAPATPTTVQKWLNESIAVITENPSAYVLRPGKDFTRNRKLNLSTMMQMLVCMGGNTLTKELYDWFEYSKSTASASAFVQQRQKILATAFEVMFKHFVRKSDKPVCYKNYRVFAVDGSDLRLPANAADTESYIKTHEQDEKGYNLVHLDAMFDLLRNVYVDASVQAKRGQSEHRAFVSMIDRSTTTGKVLVIADRGYESFNNMAHCIEKGWSFIIRAKDSYGIITKTTIPVADEFDVPIKVSLTRCQTKITKPLFQMDPCRYRWLPPSATFDYLPPKSKSFYEFDFRIVRFEISPGVFETVYTNLPVDQFPAIELQKLYQLRWGIETSFRELKYAIGLASVHSKQRNSMLQEVYARLLLYNFTSQMIQLARPPQEGTRTNFPDALLFCRQFMRQKIAASTLLKMIERHRTPIRSGRRYPRYQKHLSAMSLNYRIV